MNSASKDIIEKVRQLSDLLIVIKDSGNNTPQILKELAVEKCSEIYNLIASVENISDEDKLSNCYITEPTIENSNDNVEDNTSEEMEISAELNNEDTSISNIEISLNNENIEITSKEHYNNFEIEELLDDKEDEVLNNYNFNDSESDINSDSENVIEEQYNELIEEPHIESKTQNEEDLIYSVTEENNIPTPNNEYENIVLSEEDSYKEIDMFEEENKDENIVIINDCTSPIPPKDIYKKFNHKKIRSVLSINDIFLYKRELFGNSDVDMTDMFDGIDEAESFNDAMELISEYFGSDVDSEEMVIEFVERVKQCFE